MASQPLLITTSQVQSSKAPSMTSPSDTASFSKQHSMHFAVSTSSQSMVTSGTNMQGKLKNATGRPAPISLLPSGGGQRKVQKWSFVLENTYLYSCWKLFVKINICTYMLQVKSNLRPICFQTLSICFNPHVGQFDFFVEEAVASWLVRLSSDWAVWVLALAGDIVLCSWARHFTLTVTLSTQVYKWVPANLMQGVTLRWTSIPSRGE